MAMTDISGVDLSLDPNAIARLLPATAGRPLGVVVPVCFRARGIGTGKPLANAAGPAPSLAAAEAPGRTTRATTRHRPLPPWSSYWLAGRSIPPSEAMPSRKLAPPVPAT